MPAGLSQVQDSSFRIDPSPCIKIKPNTISLLFDWTKSGRSSMRKSPSRCQCFCGLPVPMHLQKTTKTQANQARHKDIHEDQQGFPLILLNRHGFKLQAKTKLCAHFLIKEYGFSARARAAQGRLASKIMLDDHCRRNLKTQSSMLPDVCQSLHCFLTRKSSFPTMPTEQPCTIAVRIARRWFCSVFFVVFQRQYWHVVDHSIARKGL